MPFKEQEAKSEYQIIDGKKVHVITPEVEITLTNTETGKEYMSDAEADADVDNPETDTKESILEEMLMLRSQTLVQALKVTYKMMLTMTKKIK